MMTPTTALKVTGCRVTVFKDRRALDGSNAKIAPRLGSLRMLKNATSKDVKNARNGRFHVACGSTPALMTMRDEIETTFHMIVQDARLVNEECVQFLVDDLQTCFQE
jgi:hypothetical protein